MTENEKLDLILSKLESLEGEVKEAKGKLEIVERDVKHLKKQSIRQQAMDEAILDEVERVHDILNMHKADRSAHMA